MMRWFKRFVIAIVLLLFLVVAGALTVLLTPAGVKLAVWGAQEALPELTIEKSRGALLNGFALEGVAFSMDGFSLSGQSLSLDINSKCLSGPALCVESLTGDGIKVVVGETEPAPASPPSEPLTEIKTPVPLFLSGVALSDISLDILGTKVHWDSLTTAAQMQGNTVTLKPTEWKGIKVELAQSEEKPAKPEATSTSDTPIELPAVNIPLNVVIEGFALKDALLMLPQKQVIHEFFVKGKAGGPDIVLEDVRLDAEQGKVSLNGDISLKDDYPLNLAANAKVRMEPLQGHSLTLDAKGDLCDLAIKANLKGVLLAALSGRLNVLDPNLPFNVLLTSKNLQWPVDSNAEYKLTSTAINASGSLKKYSASVKTQASGEAIPDIDLSTKLKGDLGKVMLGDISLKTLGGGIDGWASVDWTKQVKWQTRLAFSDIQPGLQWPEAEGKLSGEVQNSGEITEQGGWLVRLPELDIEGIIRDQALDLSGQLNASDVKGKGDLLFETKGLSLRHGPNQIDVSGKVDKALALKLNLNLPKLSASVPQAGGSIKGNIGLSGTLEKPEAALLINANALRWEELVTVQDVSIRGSVKPLPIIGGGLIVDVNGVKAEGVEVKTLALRASGDEKDQTVSLKVDGKPVSANLSARGSLDREKGWKGTLYSSAVKTPIGPWKLVNNVPLSVNFKSGVVEIGAFCWTQNQSQICLDKPAKVADSGEAQLSIVDFNLDVVQSFLPVTTTIEGMVTANANVAWKPNVLPNLKASVDLSKGKVTEQLDAPLTLGWDAVNIDATLANNTLNADVLLALTDNGKVTLRAVMGNLESQKRTLKSTFDIDNIDLDILAPALGEDTKLAGMLSGNVSLNGDLEAPTANGSIELSGLKLQSLAAPVEVREGQITALLNGTNGRINGDIKTPDGDLVLTGHADWKDLNAWLASLNVKGQRLKVVVPPMVAMEVSPDMTLNASPKSVNVNGSVSVPWGRIVVENLPASAVQVSSDVVILNDDLQPVSEEESNPITVNANIAVNIGDDVRLEAFGLRTNLVGKLDVASNRKGPSVNGEINLEEGTYRSFGQDLQIKKGQILFNGPPEQPYLQVEAIRNPDAIEDGVEAGIRVTGPADAPEVQVFSDPAMPQANALSYLTRGRNLDSESDGNAMTSMLIGLGLSQSGKLVGQIGQAFGVQDLSVDTSGSGNDEKVEVSGYILPGLQVKYGVGIFTSLPEFTVRYRLLSDLYVEAVSGADNAVDLLYQFSIK
ncbi:autotransporter assembly complex protein TamB [Grimontia sp. NTOU-MAR1]|uniref:autotransporter assembly complex protein TamB n=1 Tax=Grimontia sp. NTOU-MAR1 TaxID=3111011 RepID=UPI002DBBB407|nr:translocation/assembly module TamB domain-containing protein [Grimontia sp. NTOU-MAR1]WRV96332.1 translocation/assembly module TamB domain-containing protein [Grimontia sp. NTOU-MAR1]